MARGQLMYDVAKRRPVRLDPYRCTISARVEGENVRRWVELHLASGAGLSASWETSRGLVVPSGGAPVQLHFAREIKLTAELGLRLLGTYVPQDLAVALVWMSEALRELPDSELLIGSGKLEVSIDSFEDVDPYT